MKLKIYIFYLSAGRLPVGRAGETLAKFLPEELMLKDVNVLGAGDTFASCFLHKLLQNEGDIHNWIEFAHLKTTEIIRNSI